MDIILYILTYNCARNPIDETFSANLFHALPVSPPPHLLVLSLQELAPIAYAFLGGSYITPYFDAFIKAVDDAAAARWPDPQHAHAQTRYVLVAHDHAGMTGLMVFARADVVAQVVSVQTARVGLGLRRMGNKGAVGARLAYGTVEPVELTFVAAHLAAAEGAVERRNEDWRGIVEGLVFEGGEMEAERAALLGTEEEEKGIFTSGYLFLAGDLNYRTSDTLPGPDDHTHFPRLDAPSDSPRHYSRLLEQDQLTRERGKGRCFHGLSEAPVAFPPTYKYRIGARDPRDWTWTTARWPSWCDRVLYRTSPTVPVTPYRYDALPLFPMSDHRAVALTVGVSARPPSGPEDEAAAAPFPIDRDWKRKRDEARRRELLVGGLAYLGLTWEGNRVLLAMVVGGLGVWFVLRRLLFI